MLPMLILLAATFAAPAAGPETARGAIEATIRGTNQPLEVELLLRTPSEAWEEVDHKRLPAGTRKVRFEGLASGVYQILLRGPSATERLGTKIGLGTNDTRRTTITVEPFPVTGRVAFGGTHLGTGVVELHHRELRWRAGIGLEANGTFRATLWQRGVFLAKVHSPALPTSFNDTVELAEGEPAVVQIAIPDGRITGIVRDAQSGAPVSGAIVSLQTTLTDGEQYVRLNTGPEGTFDFAGIKYGKQTVRVYPPRHLEPEPVSFPIDDAQRLRELDFRLDAGREIAIAVIDRENDPVAEATVFAVTGGQLRSRTTTDEDGRATIAAPDEAVTLFVAGKEGPFGMLRVRRDQNKGRLPIYLPRSMSSLRIRALTTTGATMPPISLLMRYDGELVPLEVAEELTSVQGLQLMTGSESEAHLQNIPSGSYEFWPYRTEHEAESIAASADALLAPIQVNVRVGENKIVVKFAGKSGAWR